MNLRHVIAVVGMTVALTGCATAYQSKGFTGGFSETMLSPDTFKIQFAGNAFTSAERASDFAILRAADKSLELGCNYFGVMSEADGASVGSVTLGSVSWGNHSAWGFSNTMPVVKPNSSLLVKCSRDQQPGSNLFDAHFIAQSIRSKYGIKPAVSSYGAQSIASYAAPVTSTPATGTAALASDAAPVAVVALSSPLANYADMVISAQKVSAGMGCGDVKATGAATFQADCSSYTVAIDCDGGACHPAHTVATQ